ncbi:MAG: hypothetical protein A3E80_02060 [Chlamydiae bacterium RIFCSPHIGHO2_12_FULL_49_9]|nr:MAG: hypothetical protein A3E80_02060 [Chlamydiae bacterium RIFCSPHIGHO2_12_FULL_49_9]
METVWVIRFAFALLFLAGLFVALFLTFPNAVRHYTLWKACREEKHLAAWFSEAGIALFLVLAVFFILFHRLFGWWQTIYAS